MGGCTGITVTDTGNVGSGMALTGTGGAGVAWASVAVIGVAVPIVMGVGGMWYASYLPPPCFMPATSKISKDACYNALALLSL